MEHYYLSRVNHSYDESWRSTFKRPVEESFSQTFAYMEIRGNFTQHAVSTNNSECL
jgi:hypothetical protein